MTLKPRTIEMDLTLEVMLANVSPRNQTARDTYLAYVMGLIKDGYSVMGTYKPYAEKVGLDLK